MRPTSHYLTYLCIICNKRLDRQKEKDYFGLLTHVTLIYEFGVYGIYLQVHCKT